MASELARALAAARMVGAEERVAWDIHIRSDLDGAETASIQLMPWTAEKTRRILARLSGVQIVSRAHDHVHWSGEIDGVRATLCLPTREASAVESPPPFDARAALVAAAADLGEPISIDPNPHTL